MARSRRLEVVIAGDPKGALGAMSVVDRRAGKLGGSFAAVGTAAVAGFAVVGAAAVGAGAALFAIGSSFDQAYDKIRVGTGATGEALEGLKDSFRNVAREVPASFGDIGTAIADINTRLGLTGAPLEAISGQMLNLSRITETDLTGNIESLTRVMGDWGVEAGRMPQVMDQIFRGSQATGAGVDTLAAQVVQFGAPLRNLGFSLEESVAMFGAFEQQGVNIQTIMPGLRQGLKNFASAGRDPAEAFAEFAAGVADGSLTMTDAMETFGARAGADMFTAMAEGRFDMAALVDTISNGSDTINRAAADTEDFGEKWTRIKNRVLLALEPVAMRVFDGMGQLMDDLAPKVDQLAAWFSENLPPAMERIRQVAEDVWPKVRNAFVTAVDVISRWWDENGPAIMGALNQLKDLFVQVFDNISLVVSTAFGVIQNLWDRFGEQWLAKVQTAFSAIVQIVGGAFEAIRGVFQVFAAVFRGDWGAAWDGVKAIFHGIWEAIKGILRLALNTVSGIIGAGMAVISAAWGYAWRGVRGVFVRVWDGIRSGLRGALDAIKGAIRGAVSAIGSIWGGIKSAMTGPLNWVIDNVINRFLGIMRTVADVVNLGGIIPGNVGHVGGGGGTGGGGRRLGLQYHSGGVVGEYGGGMHRGPLRPGEVPAILQTGETVVDRRGRVAGRPAADVIAERYGISSDSELRAMGLPVGGFPNPVSAIAGIAQDAINAVSDRLRDLAAGGLARLLDPVRGAIGTAGDRFGTPGKIFAGMVNKPIDALLMWVAGAANEADKRTAPTISGDGMIWQQLFNAVRHQFPDVALHSAFRPGAITATGNRSLHSRGRAIDISPRMDIFNWIAANYPGSGELIFSPAGGRQLYRGAPHFFGEPTRGDHWDHIHWGMFDRGGFLEPGWTMAYNGTGRPEPVGHDLAGGSVNLTVEVHVAGSVLAQGDLLQVFDDALRRGFTSGELERLIRRTAN